MRARPTFLLALGLLAAALFASGVVRLFQWRFQSGDIYPPSSSLRADPLGTRLFFESLSALPGYAPERNFRPLHEQFPPTPSTLVLAGHPIYRVLHGPARWFRELEQYASRGGRVILLAEAVKERGVRPLGAPPAGFSPGEQERSGEPPGDDTSTDAAEEPPSGGPGGEEPGHGAPPPDETPATRERRLLREWNRHLKSRVGIALSNEWDVAVGFLNRPPGEMDAAEATPGAIPWHSLLAFTPISPEWKVVFAVDGQPVWIERDVGSGQLVLISDPYIISNEALLANRRTDLLLRLAGPHALVVFDESQHGIEAPRGVMMLARKYRLGGFFASVILLALLLVWKNAATLVPRRPRSGRDMELVSGLTAQRGLANLLRRNIPSRRVLEVCLEEWARTRAPRHPGGELALRRMRLAIEAEQAAGFPNPPPSLYRQLQQTLNEEPPRHA